MSRLGAWTISIACLALGIVSFLGAISLLRPATNPVSDAAAGFQAGVFQGTALAAVLFFFAEVAAWRWSAPAGGWRWAWLVIGAFFLLLGGSLLVEALPDQSPLGGRTRGFRLGIGGLWTALGIAGCALPFAQGGPKPPV
jgi:hypothetical protein